jgi:isochorismate hydrolase
VVRIGRLEPDRAMLLVIDVQEKLLPSIDDGERVVRQCDRLIRFAKMFDMPVLLTEQYPKGIGPTDGRLVQTAGVDASAIATKMRFSCCGDEGIRERLREMDREQIVVCGIEAHVCVQQTSLDLFVLDYQVVVCADAVGSRRTFDYEVALDRMRQGGVAVSTVESVMFELCGECGTERFKSMLSLVKDS